MTMNDMPYRYLLSSSSAARSPASGFERLMARLLAVMVWFMLAAVGLVFALSLGIWLLLLLLLSLVRSVFTGRPAAATLLWRQWREQTRQRWPGMRSGSATPRADAADATGASGQMPERAMRAQDVAWRDVPATPEAPEQPRQESH